MFVDWERKSEPIAPLGVFLARWARWLGAVLLFVGASLGFGVWGYGHFEGMPVVDAFENAAMILSGMGPVEPMRSEAGKVFAGLYAIYSGIVVIAATGVLLAPLIHRVVHRLHVPDDTGD